MVALREYSMSINHELPVTTITEAERDSDNPVAPPLASMGSF
jgi:hypothetical protein